MLLLQPVSASVIFDLSLMFQNFRNTGKAELAGRDVGKMAKWLKRYVKKSERPSVCTPFLKVVSWDARLAHAQYIVPGNASG